ncbi:MAG TPA: hypothetical protein VJR30_06615 [Bradyrhizobium sp.]|nr:hypothetical protein [Bradyrhizobium sp.]
MIASVIVRLIKEYVLQIRGSRRYRYEQNRHLEAHLKPYAKDPRQVSNADIIRIIDASARPRASSSMRSKPPAGINYHFGGPVVAKY